VKKEGTWKILGNGKKKKELKKNIRKQGKKEQ
jgi:hypothetical protein